MLRQAKALSLSQDEQEDLEEEQAIAPSSRSDSDFLENKYAL